LCCPNVAKERFKVIEEIVGLRQQHGETCSNLTQRLDILKAKATNLGVDFPQIFYCYILQNALHSTLNKAVLSARQIEKYGELRLVVNQFDTVRSDKAERMFQTSYDDGQQDFFTEDFVPDGDNEYEYGGTDFVCSEECFYNSAGARGRERGRFRGRGHPGRRGGRPPMVPHYGHVDVSFRRPVRRPKPGDHSHIGNHWPAKLRDVGIAGNLGICRENARKSLHGSQSQPHSRPRNLTILMGSQKIPTQWSCLGRGSTDGLTSPNSQLTAAHSPTANNWTRTGLGLVILCLYTLRKTSHPHKCPTHLYIHTHAHTAPDTHIHTHGLYIPPHARRISSTSPQCTNTMGTATTKAPYLEFSLLTYPLDTSRASYMLVDSCCTLTYVPIDKVPQNQFQKIFRLDRPVVCNTSGGKVFCDQRCEGPGAHPERKEHRFAIFLLRHWNGGKGRKSFPVGKQGCLLYPA